MNFTTQATKFAIQAWPVKKATKFTFCERHTHDHADHILSQRKVPECKICITVMSNSLQFAQRFKTLLPNTIFFSQRVNFDVKVLMMLYLFTGSLFFFSKAKLISMDLDLQ